MVTVDPRIEGMKPSQITKKFVRENLTEEEAEQVQTKVVTQEADKEFPLDCTDKEDLVTKLEEVLDFVTDNDVSYSDMSEYELVVCYKKDKIVETSAVDYFQDLWKKQLKQLATEQKEYAEWERLNKKFAKEPDA